MSFSRVFEVEDVYGVRETDKALLVSVAGERQEWVPKNQIDELSDVKQQGDEGVLTVSYWFAEKVGWTLGGMCPWPCVWCRKGIFHKYGGETTMVTTATIDEHKTEAEEPIPETDPAPPSLRERMRIRSPMPALDDRFVEAIDFPGTTVRPGATHERSFAVARECRIAGVSLPKGLRVLRIVLKVGPRFRVVPKDGQAYPTYEGEDVRVFEGEAIREGAWKTLRLVPEMGAFLYVLVRNDTDDDLRFEGTLRFAPDSVPTPEHEEL